MPRISDIRIRRDTAANWTTADPALAVGELGIETDTRRMKVGTGSAVWSSLQYMGFDGLKPEIADGLNVIAGREYSYTIGTAPDIVICTMRAVQSRAVGAFATDAEKITELDPANWTLITQSGSPFVRSTVLPQGYFIETPFVSGRATSTHLSPANGGTLAVNVTVDHFNNTPVLVANSPVINFEERRTAIGTTTAVLRATSAHTTNAYATQADRAAEFANWTLVSQSAVPTGWAANAAHPANYEIILNGIRRRRATPGVAGPVSVVGVAADLVNWPEVYRETPLVLAPMTTNGEARQSAANLGPTFTVDQYRYATIAQVIAGIVATLPAPTDAAAVRTFSIFNSGTAMTIENKPVPTNGLTSWTWIGGGWR